jgi:hypothetical protein
MTSYMASSSAPSEGMRSTTSECRRRWDSSLSMPPCELARVPACPVRPWQRSSALGLRHAPRLCPRRGLTAASPALDWDWQPSLLPAWGGRPPLAGERTPSPHHPTGLCWHS